LKFLQDHLFTPPLGALKKRVLASELGVLLILFPLALLSVAMISTSRVAALTELSVVRVFPTLEASSQETS
jgi:hypothetical protein